eukprot:comp21842_c0_seq1/m.49340 comp21842_c0_seq1/g.49340  ORF comp21842_c0_seq1/g.49340 comp21842_c0_seq1/m.49340 type:complete len:1056 (+) comp21842_c0_seq1:79-3246(+)
MILLVTIVPSGHRINLLRELRILNWLLEKHVDLGRQRIHHLGDARASNRASAIVENIIRARLEDGAIGEAQGFALRRARGRNSHTIDHLGSGHTIAVRPDVIVLREPSRALGDNRVVGRQARATADRASILRHSRTLVQDRGLLLQRIGIGSRERVDVRRKSAITLLVVHGLNTLGAQALPVAEELEGVLPRERNLDVREIAGKHLLEISELHATELRGRKQTKARVDVLALELDEALHVLECADKLLELNTDRANRACRVTSGRATALVANIPHREERTTAARLPAKNTGASERNKSGAAVEERISPCAACEHLLENIASAALGPRVEAVERVDARALVNNHDVALAERKHGRALADVAPLTTSNHAAERGNIDTSDIRVDAVDLPLASARLPGKHLAAAKRNEAVATADVEGALGNRSADARAANGVEHVLAGGRVVCEQSVLAKCNESPALLKVGEDTKGALDKHLGDLVVAHDTVRAGVRGPVKKHAANAGDDAAARARGRELGDGTSAGEDDLASRLPRGVGHAVLGVVEPRLVGGALGPVGVGVPRSVDQVRGRGDGLEERVVERDDLEREEGDALERLARGTDAAGALGAVEEQHLATEVGDVHVRVSRAEGPLSLHGDVHVSALDVSEGGLVEARTTAEVDQAVGLAVPLEQGAAAHVGVLCATAREEPRGVGGHALEGTDVLTDNLAVDLPDDIAAGAAAECDETTATEVDERASAGAAPVALGLEQQRVVVARDAEAHAVDAVATGLLVVGKESVLANVDETPGLDELGPATVDDALALAPDRSRGDAVHGAAVDLEDLEVSGLGAPLEDAVAANVDEAQALVGDQVRGARVEEARAELGNAGVAVVHAAAAPVAQVSADAALAAPVAASAAARCAGLGVPSRAALSPGALARAAAAHPGNTAALAAPAAAGGAAHATVVAFRATVGPGATAAALDGDAIGLPLLAHVAAASATVELPAGKTHSAAVVSLGTLRAAGAEAEHHPGTAGLAARELALLLVVLAAGRNAVRIIVVGILRVGRVRVQRGSGRGRAVSVAEADAARGAP